MNKCLLFLLCGGLAAQAQSISITSPTASQSVSSYSGFSFTGTIANASSAYRVCWSVDAYQVGCATSPYSLPWNTFGAWNGTHAALATLYDALNNVLATATPVSFTIQNTWPVAYGPGMTVATGTALSSNWSGSVSITPTITGSGAAHSKNTTWFVDGAKTYTDSSDISTSPTFTLDTTRFPNGSHILAAVTFDKSGGTTYPAVTDPTGGSFYAGLMTEWSATVSFANGATPMAVVADQREMFLQPGGTHQLAPTLVNTDGSTAATTPVYLSENTAAATVSSGGLVTAVATGGSRIDIMAPTITGTDLACQGPCSTGLMTSAAHPFSPQDLGRVMVLTSANGWAAGTYLVNGTTVVGGAISLATCLTCAKATPGVGSTGNGHFSTGPTRAAWAFTLPSNAIAHFGTDASILTTYTPGKSFFRNSAFFSYLSMPASASIAITNTDPNDQPYSPGFLADYSATGFNVLEKGYPNYPTYSQTQSQWQTATAANVTAVINSTSAFPNLKFGLIGDGWQRLNSELFDVTRGPWVNSSGSSCPGGPPCPWSTAPLTYVLNQYNGYAVTVDAADEVQTSWNSAPLQGPLTFSHGLTSVVASGGTCTVNGAAALNATHHFVINGSAVTNMNSVVPAVYSASSASAPFTFTCTGVADGIYGAGGTADPGFNLEPFAVSWENNNTTGTTVSPNDYIRYTAFSSMKTWINAANSGRAQYTWPNAAGTSCPSIANWNNPANGLADYSTMYYTSFGATYLGSRSTIPGLMTSLGDIYRGFFGCFSPSAPVIHQSSATPSNYGFQGYPLTVTSFSGNTLTFSAPHGVYNILPGISRLWLSGMSNAADNGNYYIIATPTATTMTVYNSKTDFTASGITGGTLTFLPSGVAYPLSTIVASGTNSCSADAGSGVGAVCGDAFVITGFNSAVARHRGETFTITGASGTGSTSVNSRTFYYSPENIAAPTGTYARYRELPQGSSISGTATIVPDNSFIPGRNGSTQVADDPDVVFAGIAYAMILRGAGTRMYSTNYYQHAYIPTGGFVGNVFDMVQMFNDDSVQGQQLYSHPHWENYLSVPDWHAAGLANLLNNRIAPYALTSSLASPDYGPAFECTARTGAKGQMLACVNMTNAPQTGTFNLSPYSVTGQNIVQFLANSQSITLITLSAGTTSAAVTLPAGAEVVFLFPNAFASELHQPVIAMSLSDIANATKIAVRYGYDQYVLDAGNTVFDCGIGSCTLPVDQQIGPVFYRLIYLGANGNVLAISDVQTF